MLCTVHKASGAGDRPSISGSEQVQTTSHRLCICAYRGQWQRRHQGAFKGLEVIVVLSSSSLSLVKKKLGKKTIHYIIIISSAACDHIQVPWTPENTD
jgi:hypothetical protein